MKDKKMKIRYVSDLHLEINHKFASFIQGSDDEYLVVAGDTVMAKSLRKNANDAFARGHKELFARFLEQVSGFRKVFFIMGNHEHYTGNIDTSYEYLTEFIELHYPNNDKFYVLENQYHILDTNPEVILVGATLWTDMGKNNPMSHWNVGRGMNDFRIIKTGPDNIVSFTTENAMAIHNESVRFIDATAKAHPNYRVIVATHHAPHYKSNGVAHTSSIIIDGYCSDLSELIASNPNITDWVHGHTHTFADYDIAQCRVRANQQGYRMENSFFDFTKKRFSESYISV